MVRNCLVRILVLLCFILHIPCAHFGGEGLGSRRVEWSDVNYTLAPAAGRCGIAPLCHTSNRRTEHRESRRSALPLVDQLSRPGKCRWLQHAHLQPMSTDLPTLRDNSGTLSILHKLSLVHKRKTSRSVREKSTLTEGTFLLEAFIQCCRLPVY